MIGTILLEIEPVYDQEQDTTIFNWRGYRQIKRGKVLQQTKSHLGIQQHINQRRE